MLSAEKLLAMWEAGVNRRPLERAIGVLRTGGMERPGEKLEQLALGCRDGRLLSLREEALGPEVSGAASCAHCGEAVEVSFRAEDIRLPEAEQPELLRLEHSGYALSFNLPTTEELLAVEMTGDEEADEQRLLRGCIAAAVRGDEPVAPEKLPAAVQEAVMQTMAACDPQAEVEIALTCPACRAAWSEIFDIESFFWNELQAWAGRMLREVHQLACAYGWSERQILALPPLRRSMYLNMVAE